jgi:hypothetical protein
MSSFCAKIHSPKNYKPNFQAHKSCAKSCLYYIGEIDTWAEVTGSDKPSSLLQYGNNYDRKMFLI